MKGKKASFNPKERSPQRKHPQSRNPKPRSPNPTDLLYFERGLISQGYRYVAGVDEVGRGCLAGPVFAGAVILPSGLKLPKVDDSKKLTAALRESLFGEITRMAVAWSVASVSAEEIDRINIHHASLKAMRLAVEGLSLKPDYLLIDGRFDLGDSPSFPQKAVVDGDALSQSIAAASIVAKVTRDHWIAEQEKKYPQFRFSQHKGYGTPQHRREIAAHGPTPLHRRSFRLA